MVVIEDRMGVSLGAILALLPSAELETVEARTTDLVAQEMSLRDLRKALGKTQVAMAHELGIKQENVSRIEQRSDMLLSTLNGYLRGMGGRLRLVAEFDGRPPVELAGFASMADATRAGRKVPGPARPRQKRTAHS